MAEDENINSRYRPTGVVTPILLKKEERVAHQIKELNKQIAQSSKPLQILLAEEKERYDAECQAEEKRNQEIRIAEMRYNLISDEIKHIKHDIKRSAELRDLIPIYNTKKLIELEAKLKTIIIPTPIRVEDRTEQIEKNWTNESEQRKKLSKKRDLLYVELNDIHREILKDEWLPAYKQYAEDFGLEDQVDEHIIFDVCNKHYIEAQSVERRTIDCHCDCGREPVYDDDGSEVEHTYTFGDGRCTYGAKTTFEFHKVEPIGMIRIIELPAYTCER